MIYLGDQLKLLKEADSFFYNGRYYSAKIKANVLDIGQHISLSPIYYLLYLTTI